VNGTYSYDAAGRLTRIQEGAIIDIQYGYDAAGEITNANFTAPLDPATLLAPAMPTFAYDAAHQIKNSGYAFDARGRQTASPGHSYQWDGASRLVGIDGVALAYNGANDIETRTTGGVTTRYFYNHALGLTPIMAERNENTLQIQRYYVWTPGGRLLYLIDAANGNAVRFFHYDRVGSTLALTSGAGAVTDAYAYSPYGVLLGHTGTSPQPFTYVGEFGVRGEAAANLYHMRARYYDPVSARFLSQDPLPPRLADNRSLDPYNYVMENPIRYTDPEGLKAVTIAYSEHIAGISSDGKYMLYGEVIHWSDGHFTESPLTSEIIGGPADAVAHVLSDEELNALRSPGSSASATVAVGTPPPLSAKGAAQATDREVDIDGSTEFWLLRGGGVAAGVPANPPPILFSIFHLPGAAPTTDANELICLPFNLIPVGGPIIGQRGFDPFGISGKFDYVSTQEGISTGENIPWEAMFPQRK
jgi:RHS repeat-associated protein